MAARWLKKTFGAVCFLHFLLRLFLFYGSGQAFGHQELPLWLDMTLVPWIFLDASRGAVSRARTKWVC